MYKAMLNAYDCDLGGFAAAWETQPPPSDPHATEQTFFIAGGATSDIGCGSGPDAARLDSHGNPAQGFDASHGLLQDARRRHPHIPFSATILPELAEIAVGRFADVLCEIVIMHLDPEAVTPAVMPGPKSPG